MADDNDDEKPEIDVARRRLLTFAKYVPPVVLGAIALQDAGCQPSGSCGPSCGPAGGTGAPPGPSGGQPEAADQPDDKAQS